MYSYRWGIIARRDIAQKEYPEKSFTRGGAPYYRLSNGLSFDSLGKIIGLILDSCPGGKASVDGTLIEAWASIKSFQPKDATGHRN